jgi:aryl-alcohol dehydrogenase-like predicted oxidoreductase
MGSGWLSANSGPSLGGSGPTPIGRGLSFVQAPIRELVESRPELRGRVRARAAGPAKGRVGGLLFTPDGYSASAARRSIERSLRTINTDYLDLLLLHDPLPGSVRSDEVAAYLEDARAAGSIRSWGIAGEPEATLAVARSFREDVPVLQLRDDLFLRSLRHTPVGSASITFGVLSGALPSLTRHVAADSSRRDRWQTQIGADCGNPDVAASFLLRAALRENSRGVVLFSTVHPSRVLSAVEALEIFIGSEDLALDAFLRMVDLELRPLAGTQGNSS